MSSSTTKAVSLCISVQGSLQLSKWTMPLTKTEEFGSEKNENSSHV